MRIRQGRLGRRILGGRRLPVLAIACATAVGIASSAGAQPSDLEAWHRLRTGHFTVMSNADPERAGEIALGLERFRAALALLAPEIELSAPAPTRIFAFRDAASHGPYRSIPGGNGVRILGEFLSHPHGNYITVNADPSLSGTLEVTQHEFVHYFVRHNFPRVPLWFNEGLADYYSTFAADELHARIGRPVERHLAWFRQGNFLGLSDVVSAERPVAARHDAAAVGRFYAVSWALVHYLLSGDGERLDRAADLLYRIQAGEDPLSALEEALNLGLGELEEVLEAYVAAGRFPEATVPIESLAGPSSVEIAPAPSALLLTRLGELLAHTESLEAAERHFDAALAVDPRYPDAWAGLAFLRDRQLRSEEARFLWLEATSAGALGELASLLYGKHTLQLAMTGGVGGEGQPTRDEAAIVARGAFDRALEIKPDYAEAHAMAGSSYLILGGEPEIGISYLERARRLVPGRADILYHLVELHLKNNDPDSARRLLDGDLQRYGEPEMVAAATEEIERWTLLDASRRAFEGGDTEAALDLFDRAVDLTSDPDLRQTLDARLRAMRRQLEDG